MKFVMCQFLVFLNLINFHGTQTTTEELKLVAEGENCGSKEVHLTCSLSHETSPPGHRHPSAGLQANAIANRIRCPRLERWRVDVAVSSGALSRVMRPSIFMQVHALRPAGRLSGRPLVDSRYDG
jgi:hypothetical protein